MGWEQGEDGNGMGQGDGTRAGMGWDTGQDGTNRTGLGTEWDTGRDKNRNGSGARHAGGGGAIPD